MKRASLLLATALLAPVFVGCGPTTNTNDSGNPTDTGTVTDTGGMTDAAVMMDSNSGDTGAPETGPSCAPDSGAGDAGGYYLPPGCFTLTPFLSPDNAVHVFDMAEQAIEPNKDYVAVIETDVGRIVLDLTEEQTPITVNSFVFLARNHFYDGILFHRVLDGFVAQGGDPNTLETNRAVWGQGGPGYMFGVEIHDMDAVHPLRFDSAGVLGMARAASLDSNGSQFFITFAPQTSLTGHYTVFGRVLEGMDVLPMIHRNASTNVPPMVPTAMTRVYIVERPR